MENVFNYITYLHKYLNLLIETEEAYEIKNQEVKTEVKQHNRWKGLRDECVAIYTDLFLNFNNQLVNLGNILSIELSNSNAIQQNQLHDQLNDLLKEIAEKFKKAENGIGFSKESIGSKSKKILVKTKEGGVEEKLYEYVFSIDMLAYDLGDKLNQIHKLIYERFKFLNPNKSSKTEKTGDIPPSKLTNILELYFEKGCKPLNEQQVKKFANERNIKAVTSLIKYWQKLKSDDYKNSEHTSNIKEFGKSYEALMILFKDSNSKAFKEVEIRYNLLKEINKDIAF